MRSSNQLLLLCFICDSKCRLGAVNRRIRILSEGIAKEMQWFTFKLFESQEERAAAQMAKQMMNNMY